MEVTEQNKNLCCIIHETRYLFQLGAFGTLGLGTPRSSYLIFSSSKVEKSIISLALLKEKDSKEERPPAYL